MPVIALDGTDGSSKTTQAALLRDYLSIDKKLQVELIQMPGATALGKEIRQLVKSKAFPTHKITERLLFAADTAQFVHEKLLNAPPEKYFILDRASQITDLIYGAASGTDISFIDRLQDVAGIIRPCDLYIVFQIPYEIAMQRKRGRIGEACRIEDKGEAFGRRVAELFNGIGAKRAGIDPVADEIDRLISKRARYIRYVDASRDAISISKDIRKIVDLAIS